jgi:glycosidase
LSERIDYLAELGVTCLWLMPFYPTTDRDDGYDITDFYGVDPRLGTHGDFVEFVRTARDRGCG